MSTRDELLALQKQIIRMKSGAMPTNKTHAELDAQQIEIHQALKAMAIERISCAHYL